jgi:biopolymer transport protein ExbD
MHRSRNRAPMAIRGVTVEWQAEMNTTPLIDVLLVLLVMLILTMPMSTHLTTLETPRAGPDATATPQAVQLDIDFDGRLWWNGTAVESVDALQPRFAALVAAPGAQAPVRVHADRRARYELVVQVLATAQRHRVTRLGLTPLPD